MKVEDAPDFSRRGFYHDATRGKIPTLDTMFELVDKMAYYKMNELQLYVEHTYAFAKHTDIWAGSDPLTAEEILKLDEYCKKNFIDLVPSLSTFGHFYMALRSKRKEHLNELDIKASEKPFSFFARMAHYTLDCSQEESIELVRELVAEFSPLFSSKYFNICCDETFDLGKGRNKEQFEKLGEGRLYINFLKKVMEAVHEHGKVPQFWGDIMLHCPEMMPELPQPCVALNWDYAAEPVHRPCKPFADAELPFYVCPGVSGWNSCLNRYDIATKNILNYTRQGKEFGAMGMLNTDWGDYGHINLLAASYHGLILGAAASWNLDKASDCEIFDSAFDMLEMGDCSERTTQILKTAAESIKAGWGEVARWVDPSEEMEPFMDSATGFDKNVSKHSPEELIGTADRLAELKYELIGVSQRAKALDSLAYRELLCSFSGAELMHRIAAAALKPSKDVCYETADLVREYERELSALWYLRNKPSEYYRIKKVLVDIADKLEGLV
jgi:hypothetical protein